MSPICLLLAVVLTDPRTPLARVPDPSAPLPAEPDSARAIRRQKVAQGRQAVAVIARPTGDTLGPPHSIAGLEALLGLGADGVLLELTRTADGVWVLAPPPVWLDGAVDCSNLFYDELILHRFVDPVTQAAVGGTIASFREALFLLRENGALLSLEIEPGQDLADAVRAIETADLSGHFLGTQATPENLGPPVRDGTDIDLAAAAELAKAAKPVENATQRVVFVEDPRAVLSALGRPLPLAGTRAALKSNLAAMPAPDLEKEEKTLREATDERAYRRAAARLANWAPATLARLAPEELARRDAVFLAAMARALGQIAEHRPELVTDPARRALLARLDHADPVARGDVAVALAKAGVLESVPVIVGLLESPSHGAGVAREAANATRAKLAYALGRMGRRDPDSVRVLETVVRATGARADGARAAWALGRLRSAGSIPVLRDVALAEPEGNRVAALALAMIGTDEALIALETIMNTPSSQSSQIPERRAGEGAWALVRFHVADRTPILAKLLVHGSAAVRREGVLGCLQDSRPACRTLLELGAPWGVAWWEVERDSRVSEP